MNMSTATADNKLAILAGVPDVQKEKGGSKVPVVAIDKALEDKLKEIGAIKSAMKDAEGHLNLLTGEIMPVVEQMRRDLSIRERKHMTSISLAGVSTFVCQNKYSAIPESEVPRFKATFNGKFEEYFKLDTKLDVDLSKVSDEALQLLVRDGAVKKSVVMKPTEVFHTARSLDPNVAALADNAGLKPVSFLK